MQQLENENVIYFGDQATDFERISAGAMSRWRLGRSQNRNRLWTDLKKYPQEELVLTFGSRTFGKYSAVQLGTIVRERYPQVKLASSAVSGEAGFPFK